MQHLSDEQLAAQLDGPRSGPQAAAAEQHLATCESCRSRLAEFAALDESLGAALDHDPGEAYFASFAARVGERIAQEPAAAAASEPAPSRGWFAWWNSPRTLAMAGGALALVAVASLAVIVARDQGTRPLVASAPGATGALDQARAPESASPAAPQAALESAPMSAEPGVAESEARVNDERAGNAANAPVEKQRVQAPSGAGSSAEDRLHSRESGMTAVPAPVPLAKRAPMAPTGRAMEMKTLPNGEQVAVRRNDLPVLNRSPRELRTPSGYVKPGATPMAPQAAPVREERAADNRVAEPTAASAERDAPAARAPAPSPVAAKSALTPVPQQATRSLTSAPPASPPAHFRGGAAKMQEEVAADAVSPARVCGVVRDARGRPVAGAVVSVTETGESATADANGAFCLQAPGTNPTLEAYAVGFRTWRTTLSRDEAARPLAVVLSPVETLASGSLLGRSGVPGRSDAFKLQGSGAAPPAATTALTLAARAATGLANRGRTVALWQRAADEWAKVAVRAGDASPERLDARFHVAEARVQAWRIGHTSDQRAAAESAATAYLTDAPAGPLRDLAEGWRREVAP